MSSPAPVLLHAPTLTRAGIRSLLVLGLLLALVLLGPAGEAHAAKGGGKKGGQGSQVSKILRGTSVALNQLGDRYSYGASGPDSFDCSGLIQYSFRKAGLSVPRTSSAQASHARRIDKSNLKRGDLMFFHDGGGVYHAAIFLKRVRGGEIRMLHSPGSGQRVQRSTPWTSSWFAGTLRGR